MRLPNSRDRIRVSDDALQVAVSLCLDVAVAVPGVCSFGADLDSYRDHALACRRGVGRLARHEAVNDVIKNAFAEAGVVLVFEPVGLHRDYGKRLDGVTVLPYGQGLPIA